MPETPGSADALQRFGHHPDPAIDFCVEVEELIAILADRKLGVANPDNAGLDARVEKAMKFRVGGDPGAVRAKDMLREVEEEIQRKPNADALRKALVQIVNSRQSGRMGHVEPVGDFITRLKKIAVDAVNAADAALSADTALSQPPDRLRDISRALRDDMVLQNVTDNGTRLLATINRQLWNDWAEAIGDLAVPAVLHNPAEPMGDLADRMLAYLKAEEADHLLDEIHDGWYCDLCTMEKFWPVESEVQHEPTCVIQIMKEAIAALRPSTRGEVVETPPFEPTEEMWGGLARQIVLWDRFNDRSGYTLHRNLKATGHEVPEWLAKEIPATTQVPPKGTVAACIWKAMYLAHKPAAPKAQVTVDLLMVLQELVDTTTGNVQNEWQLDALDKARHAIASLSDTEKR